MRVLILLKIKKVLLRPFRATQDKLRFDYISFYSAKTFAKYGLPSEATEGSGVWYAR